MMVDSRQDDALLDVRDLRVEFAGDDGVISAVNGAGFSVRRGEILALVGESGCGKSVAAMSIMRLIAEPPGRIAGGEIAFRDPATGKTANLATLDESSMRKYRGGRIAMIFQEPMSSLNPVFTIGQQITEAVHLHRRVTRREALDIAADALRDVGMPAPRQRLNDYPHALSGGMRQRVMIAMALVGNPALLIADEPTTALDVTVQAQIIDLLLKLRDDRGMSVLFITHDLGVVAQIADRVCVMYAGRIVESSPVEALFAEPLHPYTQGLLRSLPRMTGHPGRLEAIPGSVPNPLNFPEGCRFHPRCALTRDRAANADRHTLTLPSVQNGATVLLRCVRNTADEVGGLPELQAIDDGRCVACWEVQSREQPTPERAVV